MTGGKRLDMRFSFKLAQNSFLCFGDFRTRCDFSGLELYCSEWLCYLFKVTLHCTFHCVSVIN